MWIKSELKEIERTTYNFVLNGEIEKKIIFTKGPRIKIEIKKMRDKL